LNNYRKIEEAEPHPKDSVSGSVLLNDRGETPYIPKDKQKD
jgi:hypothetical protein